MTAVSIMIVEDEGITAMDLQDTLKHLGYAVAGMADSGEDAVRLAGDLRPDLVLMDIMLKGEMDGVAAAAQVRDLGIPVVYLTAYTDESTLARAKITEAFGYLVKPFEERELHTTVEMALYKHRAEATLKGSYRRLEASLTELKAAQQRLVRQERLAAVGQLAAGIAHDFNNLLAVIMGLSQMLEMRDDIPHEAKVDLKTIYAQGQRGTKLVQQMLDFGQSNVVHRYPVDIAPFLRNIVAQLEQSFLEGIRVDVEAPAGDYTVDVNLPQLQTMMTHLAANARDAMPDGGEFRVGLSHMRVDEGDGLPGVAPGDWVVLKVSDSGEGMPPEVLAQAFEPFFTTRQAGKGTGLGLAQVHGIVKQHGGEITVQSEPGKGSCFTVFLPRRFPEQPVDDAQNI